MHAMNGVETHCQACAVSLLPSGWLRKSITLGVTQKPQDLDTGFPRRLPPPSPSSTQGSLLVSLSVFVARSGPETSQSEKNPEAWRYRPGRQPCAARAAGRQRRGRAACLPGRGGGDSHGEVGYERRGRVSALPRTRACPRPSARAISVCTAPARAELSCMSSRRVCSGNLRPQDLALQNKWRGVPA